MVTALFRALDRALEGGPCEVFPHNRKLRTSARSSFYPDLLVRSDKGTHPQYETDARFVIEVLSPSNWTSPGCGPTWTAG